MPRGVRKGDFHTNLDVDTVAFTFLGIIQGTATI
ncbi:uncharacterized protein METZ01_LOCUS14211 [marine metagenome]|uniref:Uncharacterized protein n=1 Tax=marine metagenome TaxID=408172 RepID=A0A381P4L2_9ZZZZ